MRKLLDGVEKQVNEHRLSNLITDVFMMVQNAVTAMNTESLQVVHAKSLADAHLNKAARREIPIAAQ